MMQWFKGLSLTWKIIGCAVALLLVIIAFNFVDDLLTGSDETKARLGTEQAGAAIESGKDAVGTVGDQAETEAERERKVSDLKKDVDDAETVDDAHTAGTGWLCVNFGICTEE